MPAVGSLFSGIGGLDLGLERAGWTVRWQVERDEWCQRVLAKHWPDVQRFGDIKTFLADSDERARVCGIPQSGQREMARSDAEVDLIAGGFPCQPVSLAGRRRGTEDERWLWPEFCRVVRLLRPRYVLVENVPGLLSGGIGHVLGDLAALGYDAEWTCIPAAAVGAPHLRWRVFIVAHDDGHQRRAPGAREVEARTADVLVDGVSSTDDLADSDRKRWDGRSRVFGSRRWRELENGDWWRSEPDVGRVAHGVPARVDRLRGLGNAVVPQVAEAVGRMILAHMEDAA